MKKDMVEPETKWRWLAKTKPFFSLVSLKQDERFFLWK
jgi:hypothetical protein